MIPGIELISPFPTFKENTAVAVSTISKNIEGNGYTICGPMAVGRALFSSKEMKDRRETGQKGKGFFLLKNFKNT